MGKNFFFINICNREVCFIYLANFWKRKQWREFQCRENFNVDSAVLCARAGNYLIDCYTARVSLLIWRHDDFDMPTSESKFELKYNFSDLKEAKFILVAWIYFFLNSTLGYYLKCKYFRKLYSNQLVLYSALSSYDTEKLFKNVAIH